MTASSLGKVVEDHVEGQELVGEGGFNTAQVAPGDLVCRHSHRGNKVGYIKLIRDIGVPPHRHCRSQWGSDDKFRQLL